MTDQEIGIGLIDLFNRLRSVAGDNFHCLLRFETDKKGASTINVESLSSTLDNMKFILHEKSKYIG